MVATAALAAALPATLTMLCLSYDHDTEDGVGEGTAAALAHLEGVPHLQRLSLSGCLSQPQAVPAALSCLTFLDLAGNADFWAESPTLELDTSAAPQLRHLSLVGSDLNAWPHGLPPGLTFLDLSNACACLGEAQGVVLPASLQHLAVGSDCSDLEPIPLPPLQHLTGLRHLYCTGCEALQLQVALPALTQLTSLELKYIWLEESGLMVGRLRQLESLVAESCGLAAAPSGLTACRALTRLVLSGNPFEAATALAPLPNLPHLPRLVHLGLRNCGLRGPFPFALAQRQLTELDLSGGLRPNQLVGYPSVRRWLASHFGLERGSVEDNVNRRFVQQSPQAAAAQG